MLGTLVLVLLTSQPRTVTFTHPCANSAVVLEALGKELGVKMAPGGSVKQDYFLVRFHDLPVERALSKIAEALNASWSERTGVLYLDRTPLELAKERQLQADRLRKKVAEYLNENKIQPLPRVDELAERFRTLHSLDYGVTADRSRALSLDSDSPPKRAALRILAATRIEDFLELPSGTEIVFSSAPGASRKQLTPAMRAALSTMYQEFADMEQAVSRAGLAGHENLNYVSLRWLNRDKAKNWRHDVGLVHGEGHVGVTIQQISEGEDGYSQTTAGSTYVTSTEWPTVPSELLEGLNVPLETSPFNLAVMSDLAKLQNPSFFQLAEPTQQMYRNLVEHEPLAMSPSDAILQAARIKDWNVVAILDDQLFPAPPVVPNFKTPASVLRSLLVRSDWSLEDGMLLARPRLPATTRAGRYDRALLSRIIRRASENDWMSLVDYVKLSSAMQTNAQYDSHMWLLTGLFPHVTRIMRDWRWLAFVGELVGSDALSKMGSTKSFDLAFLNKAQRDAFLDALRIEMWLMHTSSFETPGNIFTNIKSVPVPDGYKAGTARLEGKVTVSYKKTESLFAMPIRIDNTTYVSGPMTVDDLARQLRTQRAERPGPDLSRLRLLASDAMRLVVELPEGRISKMFSTEATGSNVPFVTVDELPETVRNEIKKAIRGGGVGR